MKKHGGQLITILTLIFICSGVFVFCAMARKTSSVISLNYESVPYGAYGYNFDIIAGIKEVDEEAEDVRDVTTTYANNGYSSYLKVDEDEKFVSFNTVDQEQEIQEQNNINDVAIDINAKKEGDTKVVVTYKIHNKSTEQKDISVASTTDVALGHFTRDFDDRYFNDYAAILRKQGKYGFKITQDDFDKFGFGASFDIELSPSAKSTWIGYYEDAYANLYNSSVIDEITIDNHTDSALSYSWNEALAPEETKELTATFIVKIEEPQTVSFYNLLDGESGYVTEPIVKNVVGGGALAFPPTKTSNEPGFNYKWSANEDGTGRTINGEQYIVWDGITKSYYENKYKNGVVIKPPKASEDPLKTELTLLNQDEILEQLAKDSYSDVEVGAEWHIITEPNQYQDVEEFLREKKLINETEKVNSLQELNVRYSSLIKDEDGYLVWSEPTEYNGEVEISFIIPESIREEFNSFRILKPIYPEETEPENIEIVEVPVEYNPNTGRITFKAKNRDQVILVGDLIPVTPEITLENDIIESEVGKKAQAKISLKDSNGYPIVGLKIKYEIDGVEYEAVSDEEGNVIIEVESEEAGEIIVKLKTEQTKFFNGTEKTIIFKFSEPEEEPEEDPEEDPEEKSEEEFDSPDIPDTGSNQNDSKNSFENAIAMTILIASAFSLFFIIIKAALKKNKPYKTVK